MKTSRIYQITDHDALCWNVCFPKELFLRLIQLVIPYKNKYQKVKWLPWKYLCCFTIVLKYRVVPQSFHIRADKYQLVYLHYFDRDFAVPSVILSYVQREYRFNKYAKVRPIEKRSKTTLTKQNTFFNIYTSCLPSYVLYITEKRWKQFICNMSFDW